MKFSANHFKKCHDQFCQNVSGAKQLSKKIKLDFKPQLDRDPYESLIRAIAHQQLHGKAAETILGRFYDLFPGKQFPSAEQILKIKEDKLRGCGFSQSKAKSIRDIALKKSVGIVPAAREIQKLSNEEIIERLTVIYGVGRWTVEMLLIFQLGRLDVWPVDDFGVRKGYQVWKKLKEMPTAKELKLVSKKYAPHQTILALYLWRVADLAKVNAKSKT